MAWLGPIQAAARSHTMPTIKVRAERRDRHSREVEASQAELRRSIAETKRLVDEADDMLLRHRNECEDGDAQPQGEG